MTELRVLSAEQVEALLDADLLRAELESAMIALSDGRADVPARVGTSAEDGLLLAMPGYLAGTGLATKLISLYPGNVDLPSHQGVIVLFDHRTGTPISVMDAEVISATRTAVTAAIAADVLARDDAEVLTIVGGGAQALAHAAAFARLRPWRDVLVHNRSQPAAVVVADAARAAGATRATAVDDLAAAVGAADVIALCTHADRAVIDAGRVPPGTHVSSVGSQAELPTALVEPGPVVVEWRGAVTTPPPAGAAELQHLDPGTVVELGELLTDRSLGRRADGDITVYKSTGHAVEDVAAAALVHRLAVERSIGTTVVI